MLEVLPMTRRVIPALLAAFCLILPAAIAAAQSSTTGAIVGTVYDPTGAALAQTSVKVVNQATNAAASATTDSHGGYELANLPPGTYKLTVSHAGFSTATVTGLQVEVNKSTLAPVSLKLGATTTEVTVNAGATAALQTTDAQIGNVIPTSAILRLPTLQRNATELMNLEPATVAGGANLNMRVSGALDDQNTVTLDGIDITQNVVAGNTSIPTPADSVEEFRGTVANPGASLMRASGGQVTLVGRRGTKDMHGAAYEYVQNTDLNANTWDNNRQHQPRAGINDNRFGGRLGGELFNDKTFYFVNYEGRRFKSASQVTRTVPTDTLKAGMVQFQGPGGLESFNLASASVCGPLGIAACDPRGLGVSPAVAAQWKDLPTPNLTGVGDGLNTSGYFFNIPTPTNTNYEVLRLDHTFTSNLSFNGTFTYFKNSTVGSGQVEILNGNPASAITDPQESMVPTGQLNWQISPNLLNVFRFGWVRDSSQTNATSPTGGANLLNIPGSKTADGNVALLIGSGVGGFMDEPIDMDTQRARFQGNWTGDF
ncbi:MAG: carboxypeptidase regulatory-like domain-containing protein, partial [Terriglobales bacterium]